MPNRGSVGIGDTPPRTGDTEVTYSTLEWDPGAVKSVRAELDIRGIDYYMDQGWLVVDKAVEEFVDRVVTSVTGQTPGSDAPLR